MGKTFVTGGFGALGSNITIELVKRNEEVIAHGVNEYTPANIENLSNDEKIRIERFLFDMQNTEQFKNQLHQFDLDGIIHSAAILPVMSEDPELNFKVNAGGTLAVLEAARELDLDRVIYVGSGSAYESRKPNEEPYSEDEQPSPAINRAYSFTKFIGELLCRHYRHRFGLDVVIIRVSRLWGPPGVPVGEENKWTYPMDRIINAALRGDDMVQRYGGDHPNDYTYNPEAARGIVDAYEAPRDRIMQDIYNISGGRHVTVNEIADICDENFQDVTIEFGPGYWYDLAQSIRPPFSIDAARRDLGFKPRSFEACLEEYISYRRQLFNEEN